MSLTQILKTITKMLNLDMKVDLLSSRISSKLKKNQTFKLSKKKIQPILNQMMNQTPKQMLSLNKNLLILNQMLNQMMNLKNQLKMTYTSNLKITLRSQPTCMVPQLMVDMIEKYLQNIRPKETIVS